MKQAVIIYSDFIESRHNVQSMTIDQVLTDFLKLGSSVIAIIIYY